MGFTSPPSNVFGFEYAHSGECFARFGFLDAPGGNYYEYVQGTLKTPLIIGQHYSIECYVSISDYLTLCLSDLGFYFSDTSIHITTGGRLLVTPQFENPPTNMITTHNGWQRITGKYTALGGERFFSIGNFNLESACHINNCVPTADPLFGSYLLIDDVAIYDTAKVDTIHLCINDSIQLGGQWRSSAGLYIDTIGGLPVNFYIEPRHESASLTIIDMPFAIGDSVKAGYIWVKNDTIVEVPKHNIYGCDSLVRYVCRSNVSVESSTSQHVEWNISPNPSHDFIEIKLANNSSPTYHISIFDITGKEILTQSLQQNKIDVTTLNSGMYFVKLMNAKSTEVLGVKKFVKE